MDTEGPVILFDGVCNLCQGWVRFVIRRDPGARFRFAALQSAVGQRLLTDHGLSPSDLQTVVVLEGEAVFTRSEAALRILRGLSGAWPVWGLLRVVPRRWRDWVYNWVARNRYRWFGRPDTCLVPTEAIRRRFLD